MEKEIVSVVGPGVIEAMINLAKNVPEGDFVEVGVYKGGTAQHLLELANQQNRNIYLYDTFTGIPCKDEIDSHVIGDFGDTSFEEVQKNLPGAVVVKGVFPSSAVVMGRIAFAHIDCDQYKSVKEAAIYLAPLMAKGGIMWFDDYPCLAGAKQAVDEVFGGRVENSPQGGKTIVRF